MEGSRAQGNDGRHFLLLKQKQHAPRYEVVFMFGLQGDFYGWSHYVMLCETVLRTRRVGLGHGLGLKCINQPQIEEQSSYLMHLQA